MKKVSMASLVSSLFVLALCLVLPLSAYSADKLVVKDAGGTNTVFVVQDTGNTGVGTSSPSAKLSVTDQTTTATRGIVASQNTSDPASAALILRKSRGNEATPTAVANGDYIGSLQFRTYDGTTYLRNASIGTRVNGTVSSGSVPTDIYFSTAAIDQSDPFGQGTVRMLVTSTGRVGIGTTAPTHLIQLSGGAYSDGAVWTNASSRELKENINGLTSTEAMTALVGLNPVKYNYKADKEQPHVGFIAEEVPDLVATKDRKGLSPMDIVAVLTKVVQEQQLTISQLSDKVSQLQREMKLRGSIALND